MKLSELEYVHQQSAGKLQAQQAFVEDLVGRLNEGQTQIYVYVDSTRTEQDLISFTANSQDTLVRYETYHNKLTKLIDDCNVLLDEFLEKSGEYVSNV